MTGTSKNFSVSIQNYGQRSEISYVSSGSKQCFPDPFEPEWNFSSTNFSDLLLIIWNEEKGKDGTEMPDLYAARVRQSASMPELFVSMFASN